VFIFLVARYATVSYQPPDSIAKTVVASCQIKPFTIAQRHASKKECYYASNQGEKLLQTSLFTGQYG
jgi:hypothetical protein